MVSSALAPIIIVFSVLLSAKYCQGQTATESGVTELVTTETPTSTGLLSEALSETTTLVNEVEKHPKDGYIDMEIISIRVLPSLGNSVEVSWGNIIREYNLNWTFGVYFGLTADEALQEPKLTTQDLYAVVHNLSFCSQYVFAVGVMNVNRKVAHPPRNIRTIGTLIDNRSAPQDLQVEFISDEHPCLLIKWSASCPNIAVPLGYSVTVFEKSPSRVTIITVPRTTASDLSQTLRVIYGKSYDIKVSTDVIAANSTAIVSYKVPLFLQPYRLRLTSQPDGTFMMYWREPYVPYYIGPYHYEVYVYPGRGLASKYEMYVVNKPIFIFQGNQTGYTFMVGLRSTDGAYKSYLTDPIAKSLYGEASTLNIS